MAPIIIGLVLSIKDGYFNWQFALVCLLTALTLQIGTNLANDYFDFKKGIDTKDRLGPTRVTQAGLISPQKVRSSFIFFFFLSALLGSTLIFRGGRIFAIFGVLSIFSGIFYTGGTKPLGYIGLGDLLVLIFFGPVAVLGTYYLQTLQFSWLVLLMGFSPGLISVAILCVNNIRDIKSDSLTGKKTLSVRFGLKFAKREYIFTLLLGLNLPLVSFLFRPIYPGVGLCLLCNLFAIPLIKSIQNEEGILLNKTLAQTGKLLLFFSFIFSLGWLI